ncbi:unnamed protein product, partial [Larinioides sclopetarius]
MGNRGCMIPKQPSTEHRTSLKRPQLKGSIHNTKSSSNEVRTDPHSSSS